MRRERLPIAIMLGLLITAFGISIPRVHAAMTTVLIDPSAIIDETMVPGKNFTVTVRIADVENLFAYELKVYYNNTILNATKAARPAGQFLEPSDPANQFIPKWEVKNNFNATHGRIWLSFTLLSPETARTGSGALVEITYNVIGVGFTPIELADTKLASDLGMPIVHEDSNSLFSNAPTPPPPPPPKPAYVYIDPPDITDPKLTPSSNFTVNVNIVNATDVYSFEFRLDFNPAILESFDLQEGSFLSNGNVTLSATTINNTEGYVSMNSTLTDLPAVSGDGNLAIMSFNVLKTGSTPLTISELILRNATEQILNVTSASSHFSNVALEGDINGDGIVDILDLNAASTAFGTTPDSPRWNPAADLNNDGTIDVLDLVIILINFGSVVPEYPSYVLLLIFAAAGSTIAIAVIRKKRMIKFKA